MEKHKLQWKNDSSKLLKQYTVKDKEFSSQDCDQLQKKILSLWLSNKMTSHRTASHNIAQEKSAKNNSLSL
jgi:hypothetical protein